MAINRSRNEFGLIVGSTNEATAKISQSLIKKKVNFKVHLIAYSVESMQKID